jgi:hypothetical protein
LSIFISHSSSDKEFVRQLVYDLKNEGHVVWLDENELNAGDLLEREIHTNIHRADWFVLVVSPNSASSDWVRREVAFALTETEKRRSFKFLPVIIENSVWPDNLPEIKYINFHDNYPEAFKTLLATIESVHFMKAWNDGKLEAAYARKGLPFGPNPHRITGSGFGIDQKLMAFYMIQTEGLPDVTASYNSACAFALNEHVQSGAGLTGDLTSDTKKMFMLVDEKIKDMWRRDFGNNKPLVGAKLGIIYTHEQNILIYTAGRVGGFVALEDKCSDDGFQRFFSSVLDAKFSFTCLRPGRDFYQLALESPLGHLSEIHFLEPRVLVTGNAKAIAVVTNFLFSPETGVDVMGNALSAMDFTQMAYRITAHGRAIQKIESRPIDEVFVLMVSMNEWSTLAV